MLIDVDHVPEILRTGTLDWDGSRPPTHSIATIVALCILSVMLPGAWKRTVLAVAFGIAAHLFRDMATGGVPLFWPVTSKTVEIEYGTYFLCLTGFVVIAVVRLMTGSRVLRSRRSEAARKAGEIPVRGN